MSDDIYLDGRHYDGMFSGQGEDLPFWTALAGKYGDPILELACGTGRVTLHLVQQGFQVTGIDNAEAMLAEAREKAAAAGLPVSWVEADMAHFSLDRRFRLIILPFNALCHLLTLAEFEGCMESVRAHLAPGGRFAIDVFVPKMELLVNRPGERSSFSEYQDPDGDGLITVTEAYTYEPDTQIKRITTYHRLPNQEEVEGQLNMRMYFPQELDALLRYNGFEIEAKYGRYDLAPFGPNSEKQLIVCAKTIP